MTQFEGQTMTQYLDEYEQRVSEAVDSLWDALVDPREAYLDDEGMWWKNLSGAGAGFVRAGLPYLSEDQLAEVRLECRRLVATNEFAINGVENRATSSARGMFIGQCCATIRPAGRNWWAKCRGC
jgi:hypothetical protein